MYLRVKEEQVEYVRYGRGSGKWAERSGIVDGPDAGDSAELAGGRAADGVSRAGGKQIEAHLGQSRTIDLSKLDFQQHFLCPHWTEREHVHDILGISRGQRARMLGDVLTFGPVGAEEVLLEVKFAE